MNKESIGSKLWVFPDCDLPPPGEWPLKGHESVVVLNMEGNVANLTISLYFTDRDPVTDIRLTVEGERVRCLRLDNPDDLGGFVVPRETQYALKLESDVPVTVQYGRLDTRQTNMAYYATTGFNR